MFFRKKKVTQYVGKNVVLKIINREKGTKNKKFYCQCDLIALHDYIETEHFNKPINEHTAPGKWISTKYVKHMSTMKENFNDFFKTQYNTFFPMTKQISYCGYHNIKYMHTDCKQVFFKTKWLNQLYYMKCLFNSNNTYRSRVRKYECLWKYQSINVIFFQRL